MILISYTCRDKTEMRNLHQWIDLLRIILYKYYLILLHIYVLI